MPRAQDALERPTYSPLLLRLGLFGGFVRRSVILRRRIFGRRVAVVEIFELLGRRVAVEDCELALLDPRIANERVRVVGPL